MLLVLLLFCRPANDMNDKQDRPYVCSAPGCSQVSWIQYVCVLHLHCNGYNKKYVAGKYKIIIMKLVAVFVCCQKKRVDTMYFQAESNKIYLNT